MRWVLAAILLAGCVEKTECVRSGDCASGELCVGERCVPEGETDAVHPPPDDAGPDVATPDGMDRDGPTRDAAPDAAEPDSADGAADAAADAPLPDVPLPDAAPADAAPDGPPPDAAPDGPPPDAAPDGPLPDGPLPDAAPEPLECDVLFLAEFDEAFPVDDWVLDAQADVDPWTAFDGRLSAINGAEGPATAATTTRTFAPPFTLTATFRQTVAGDGGVRFRLPGEGGPLEAVARTGAPSSVGDAETAPIALGALVHARLQVDVDRVVFTLLDAEAEALAEPAVHAARFVDGPVAVALDAGPGGLEVERLRVVPGSHADASVGRAPTGAEVCDSRDNDCDGQVDEAEQDAPNVTAAAVVLDPGTAGAPAGLAYDPVREAFTLAYTEFPGIPSARGYLLELGLHEIIAGPTRLDPNVSHDLSVGGRAVAYTGDGVTVVYSAALPADEEGPRWAVRLTHVPREGDPRSGSVTVRRRRVVHPRLVWTGVEYAVAWVELEGGIGFARAAANLTLVGEVQLFDAPEGAGWVQVDLTSTAAGFALVWTEDTRGDDTILLQRVSADGAPVGDPTPITEGVRAALPSVAWSGTHLGVAFHDARNANRTIHFKRVTAAGRLIEPELRLKELDRAQFHQEGPTVRWSGREFGVLWTGETPGVAWGADRYFMRISAEGEPCSHPTRLTHDGERKGEQLLRWVEGRWVVVQKSWANPGQRASIFEGPFAGCPPPDPEASCPPVVLDQ